MHGFQLWPYSENLNSSPADRWEKMLHMDMCMLSHSVVSSSATPTDCSPPGSSCPRDFPGKKTLEWVAISFFTTWIFSSVDFSHSGMSDSLWPHGLQHARPPCPSPTPRAYPNSCPSSWWCHPTISFSVIPLSFCLQSFPASGSRQMSQFFAWGGQSIGVSASASVLPVTTQDWSPLGWTGWISLQSKGLSRIFSNTTVQKHQFFGTQLSL